MSIQPVLNHVNVLTHDMEAMIQFYRNTLGLEPGYRPPFEVKGTWLYHGEIAFIHLVHTGHKCRNEDPAVSHFAFSATGLSKFLQQLKTLGVPYNVLVVPELNLRQVVVHDPDGNMVEVLFAGKEADGIDTAPFDGAASVE